MLKQVPATDSVIAVADDGVSIETDGLKYVINPYDELAVEEALRVRETHGGTVTIVSVGPVGAVAAIRTAMAMGADKGVLVDSGGHSCDGLVTARILAAAIRQLPHDLIIAGHRAVDDDNFQVPTAVAEFLSIPEIPMVIGQSLDGGRIHCRCTVEGGTQTVAASLPAVITAQRGLNEPRYASLPGIMKAKRKPLDIKTPADLGLDAAELEPLVRIKALRRPPKRKSGRVIQGESVQAKCAALAKALHEEAKVI